MKKKLLALMITAAMTAAMLAGCGSSAPAEAPAPAAAEEKAEEKTEAVEAAPAEETKSLKIGATVQSLSNQVWSGAMKEIETRAEAEGNTFTYMSCDDTSNKQIEQIENFISSGCDVILVHPSDANAIEAVCKQAREAGIKVMCWDNNMENTDINWVIDNEALGYMIGDQAAAFINEKFGDAGCEVAVLDYPQTQILLERENGILKALAEKAPAAKVVAQQPALDAAAGLSAMETIFQANPDVKVVCSIGGGGCVGANEAFKAKGEIADDCGVFAADATDEELVAITNGEAVRMSVMITGTPVQIGDAVYDMLSGLGKGEAYDQSVFRDIFPVNKDNAAEYLK